LGYFGLYFEQTFQLVVNHVYVYKLVSSVFMSKILLSDRIVLS